jgi:hypothetical protein
MRDPRSDEYLVYNASIVFGEPSGSGSTAAPDCLLSVMRDNLVVIPSELAETGEEELGEPLERPVLQHTSG